MELEIINKLFLELSQIATATTAKEKYLEGRKNGAYEERNRCVALLARMARHMGMNVGLRRSNIEGWGEEWHGCVYIDLPTGQVSWHYHDSHAPMFYGLPTYEMPYDGHTTPEKYSRVASAFRE